VPNSARSRSTRPHPAPHRQYLLLTDRSHLHRTRQHAALALIGAIAGQAARNTRALHRLLHRQPHRHRILHLY
jgi:hypothetical protein